MASTLLYLMVSGRVLWPGRHGGVVPEDGLHLPLVLHLGGLDEVLVVAVHGLDPPRGVAQLGFNSIDI